jgi:hypothetical protein
MGDIVSWIPFISAMAVVILGYFIGRRKQSADITKEVTDAYADLSRRVGELEEKLRQQSREIARLISGINVLIAQTRRLGEVPDWTPEMETIPAIPKNGKNRN